MKRETNRRGSGRTLGRFGVLGAGALAIVFGVVHPTTTAWGADVKKATEALKAGLNGDNPDEIRKACDELIDAGGKDAIAVVLDFLPKTVGTMGYWSLSGAAAGFRDHAALDQLATFIVSHQGDKEAPLVRDILFNLQNNNSPDVALPLAAALDKGKYDLQLMAADQLGTVRSTDSIDALVAALKKHDKDKDPELHRRIEGALVIIVGKSMGDTASWDSWWTTQKPKGVPEKTVDIGGTTSRRDGEFKVVIEKIDPRRIVVLTADRTGFNDDPRDYDFDKVQRILEDRKIPFSLIKKADFEFDPDKYLKGCWALLVNCNFIKMACVCPGCKWDSTVKVERRVGCNPKCGKHIDVSYRLKPKALQKIKSFVDEGGYLYTEDWGLIEITQVLWGDMVCSGAAGKDGEKPRLVRKLKDDKKTPEPSISVHLTPVPGVTSHPLMRGVWSKPKKEIKKGAEANGGGGTVSRDPDELRLGDEMRNHLWDIDDESPAIEVKNPDAVTVLLEAGELSKLAVVGPNTAVAVTFKGGPPHRDGATGGSAAAGSQDKAGRVLHTMSHFGHQSSSEDGQCLYNLLINFLLEAAKHHEGAPELPAMPLPKPDASNAPAPAPTPVAPAPVKPSPGAPAPAATPAAGPAPVAAASPTPAPAPKPSGPVDPNAGRD